MSERTGTGEYLLGTDRQELDRLRLQHEVWVEQARALWQRAGFRAGHTVLDLGCGPGFTSFDLARHVGPSGRVLACDRNAGFLAHLEAECARAGLDQVVASRLDMSELDLTDEVDGAYARWLFCWLDDPRAVLERTARAVRPGGAIALQEYVDWAAMKLVPRSDVFDRIIAACMTSWDEGDAEIDIAERLPTLGRECGLVVEDFRPIARIGAVGSPEWRWLDTFFDSYLPRLVERNLLSADDLAAHRREWALHAERGDVHCCTPTVADLVLRKR